MRRASREKNMTTRSKEGGLGDLVYGDSQQETAIEGLVLTSLRWLDPHLQSCSRFSPGARSHIYVLIYLKMLYLFLYSNITCYWRILEDKVLRTVPRICVHQACSLLQPQASERHCIKPLRQSFSTEAYYYLTRLILLHKLIISSCRDVARLNT